MNADLTYTGLGLYTIPEAGRLIGVPADKLRRWVDGYRFKVRGRDRSAQGLLGRDHPELAEQHVLTFLDLVELHLIARFRRTGVSMQTIRAAAEAAARVFATNHPFAIRRFHTDGKRIFAEREIRPDGSPSQRLFEELPRCQLVMEFAESFFQKLDYEGDLALHLWPLGREKGIVLDPKRAFGKPILDQWGVPTFPLYQAALTGEHPRAIAQWYRVDEAAVRAAIEYEMSLAA